GGWRLLLCHSPEAFQGLWQKSKPEAVAVSYSVMTPSLAHFLQEADRRFPGLRWIMLADHLNPGEPVPSEKHLFLSGPGEPGWGARISRWLLQSDARQRRSERQTCRGGARLRDSDYSRQQRGRKFYGEVRDVSAQGARLCFSCEIPPSESDFFEVTLKDALGQTRSYHAQVRWQKQGADGGTELGVQLLAESAM
ncbi:MAG TPA: PilZ domain-containing protein, partial [Pseudobdellovibrionaceae bacterium]|nr:PilZ domain-containing protein [Pseudobdellovibrionaceae bacterium]